MWESNPGPLDGQSAPHKEFEAMSPSIMIKQKKDSAKRCICYHTIMKRFSDLGLESVSIFWIFLIIELCLILVLNVLN